MAKQTTSTYYCDAKACQASLSESGAKSKALTDTKAELPDGGWVFLRVDGAAVPEKHFCTEHGRQLLDLLPLDYWTGLRTSYLQPHPLGLFAASSIFARK
jgi:hypothetical protein